MLLICIEVNKIFPFTLTTLHSVAKRVSHVSMSVRFLFPQWTAVQTGQWTTWSTGCCRVSRCGWSALCSTVTSGPITARRRAWASVLCGTAALAWATVILRSQSLSMAYGWARRRMLSGSDRRTSRMRASTPVSYGRIMLHSTALIIIFFWFVMYF